MARHTNLKALRCVASCFSFLRPLTIIPPSLHWEPTDGVLRLSLLSSIPPYIVPTLIVLRLPWSSFSTLWTREAL